MFRRLAVIVVGALTLVLGVAVAARAEPPTALPANAEADDLKWQPAMDYDGDGCYATPAIGPDAVPAVGLELGGGLAENCHDLSDLNNTNSYVRTWCQGEWCARTYAYYFEKDQATVAPASPQGHKHDLEHVVVWVQGNTARYVGASGHGAYQVRPASQVQWDNGTHPKIVYNKDGASTHRFRHAAAGDDPPENAEHVWQYPALISWNRFPRNIRDVFATHHYGSATLALKDSKYSDDLYQARPPASDTSFVFNFAAPVPDPPAPNPNPDPPVQDRDVFLKLMPVGDSITEGVGSSDSNGYRKRLRDKLTAGGSEVDMTGFHPSGTMVDNDTEGYSGREIDEILAACRNGVENLDPNVVTLLAGTNDLDHQHLVDTAPQRLGVLIQQIRTLRSGVVIIVATLPPSSDPAMQQRVNAYNAVVRTYVNNRSQSDHILLADMGSLTTADMADRLHPKDSGYEKMATTFTREINRAIDNDWVVDAPRAPIEILNAPDIAGIDANNDMKLYTNNGSGTLAGGSLMWPGGGHWVGFKAITGADFNGDGRADIAGIDANNDLKLYPGNGSGRVADAGATTMFGGGGKWAGFTAITGGDFNGDGKADIAGIDANNDMKLYTGNGSGTLSGGTFMFGAGGRWAGFTAIAAGDFIGSGATDIAGIDANYDMKVYTGTGTGTLTGGSSMWPQGGAWRGHRMIAAGDFG